MKQKTLDLKYVADFSVGGISTIDLDCGLDNEGVVSRAFVKEFKYLSSVSSEIIININSSGGSVLTGLNIVTAILDCKIPTTSRITGVAASMASIIALAADKTIILDYALYMVHNPFSLTGEAQDDQLEAFAGMLRVIYSKRLGMDEDEVKAFMDGDQGKDGTWYNSDKQKDIFKFEVEETMTQKSLEENISDLGDTVVSSEVVNELQLIAANITIDLGKDYITGSEEVTKEKQQVEPLNDTEVIVAATKNKKVSNKNKIDHMDLSKISASLKIEDATVEAIEARVGEIIANNSSLEKTVAAKNEELVAANSSISEKDVVIAKVSAELETAITASTEVEATVSELKAKVGEFEAAAKEAHTAKIESIVSEAAEAGKITTEAKETWLGLLVASFDSASAALEGLAPSSAAKVKLSEKVSATIEDKKEVVAKVEEEIQAKVVLPTINALMTEINSNPKKYNS